MKKLSLLLWMFVALFAVTFTSCKDDDKKDNVDDIIEDGFYVLGSATAYTSLTEDGATAAIMAAGINENAEQAKRDGMYEKYVALKGGETFSLVLREGKVETTYGATLAKVNLADENGNSVNDQPTIEIYRGIMSENTTMKVDADGLYHIVLDLNLDGKLANKEIIIAPVAWGVSGAMNGWGFSQFDTPAFDKKTMTFTMEDVRVEASGAFKFKYGNGWKIQLNALEDGAEANDPRYIKANTNLGNENENVEIMANGLVPGGKDINIKRGVYKLTLTWNLAQGELKKSYTGALTLTEELEVQDPATFVAGLSGDAFTTHPEVPSWGDPTGATLAVYSAGESNVTDQDTKAGTYVYNISNLTIDAGQIKVRYNGAWLGVGNLGDTFSVTGITYTGTDNFTTAAVKTYSNVKFTVVWDGSAYTSFVVAFTE